MSILHDISYPSQLAVEVDVGYFDSEEKKKLLCYPSAQSISEAVKNGISVSMAEFLTYYLFQKKRTGLPRYQSYRDLSHKTGLALANLHDCVQFNGRSIATAPGVLKQDDKISEAIGEAIGLGVISKIHGLSHADWQPIPKNSGRKALPSFDYELASDAKSLIQLETKGSSVTDNTHHCSKTQHHKRNIEQKKQRLSKPSDTVRYGTITAVDPNMNGKVKCWLVDPEPEDDGLDPKIVRLGKRMRFISYWISLLMPRSQLTSALATRLADIDRLDNPFLLDSVPLFRSELSTFDDEYAARSLAYAAPINVFANRSHVADQSAGGIVWKFGEKRLIFLGIDRALVEMARTQDFTKISNYQLAERSQIQSVVCRVSRANFQRFDLPTSLDRRTSRSPTVEFELKGTVHHSSGGLVFAFLPLKLE